MNYLARLASNLHPPDLSLPSQVARIMSVSHWCRARFDFVFKDKNFLWDPPPI
jgi:hypothetical protein